MDRKRKKQRQKFLLILAVIILLILIVIGVAVYVFLNNRNASNFNYEEGSFGGSRSAQTVIDWEGASYKYNDHLSNYVFMGIDTRDKAEEEKSRGEGGQADAIFLVSYDRQLETMRALIIPRDTMTEIELFNPYGASLGRTMDHINLQFAYGDGGRTSCELMEQAVSELLDGIPIHGYCALKMDGIPGLVDTLGGVELTIPDDSLASAVPEFVKGAAVTITGENAELFLRRRDITVTQSALVRQMRQKVFMQAFIKKAKQVGEKDSGIVTKMYESLKPYLVTNMGNDLFAKLLTAEVLETETLPGEGVQTDIYDEYHVDKKELEDLIMKIFYKEV